METAINISIIAACPIIAGLAIKGGTWATIGVAAALAASVGLYVGLRHPRLLYWALAAVLGAVPFGYLPGVHLPLTLGFGVAVLLAALIHPSAQTRYSPLEISVLLLVFTSTLSVIQSGRTLTDYAEFIKWTVSTLLVVALLRLSTSNLERFGRIYVYAAGLAALFALTIVVADPNGRLIRYLSVIGYGREEENTRFVYSDAGKTVRLAGTYIDPNGAGIALLVALVLCMILMRGRLKVALVVIFVAAIFLTLSRAAIFSLLGGVILVLLFHQMRTRDRRVLLGGISLSVVAALAIPQIRSRVFSSFGNEDTGSSARADALRNFPSEMSGHWLFGLGWGRPEFKNGATGFTLNHVANAPLLTVYRGGILTGLAFVAVLVIGCVIASRALRSDDLGKAAMGGVFISFCLVALQLDFPTITVPSATMMLSVFLTFMVHLDNSLNRSPDRTGPVETFV